MTTFRGEAFVAEQLTSILEQTVAPDEVIVSDDASDDRTVERVREIAATSEVAVRVITNPSNVGLIVNLSHALQQATGDVLLLADQDDVWVPTKVERTLAAFAGDPALDLLFTDGDTVDGQGHVIGVGLWDSVGLDAHRRRRWDHDPLGVVLEREVATGATMALRRRLLDAVLPIPTMRFHDSWFVLVCLLEGRPVRALPERLIRYRVHTGNQAGVTPRRLLDRLAGHAAQREVLLNVVAQWRLAAERAVGAAPEARARVLERAAFFEARARLPRTRVLRLPYVLVWLARGRYEGRWRGLRSAVFDLLAHDG